jgi:hypothetical protein
MKKLAILVAVCVIAVGAMAAEGTQEIVNTVSKQKRSAFGSFGYVPPSTLSLKLKTVPDPNATPVVSLAPETGQIVSRHEHMIWSPLKHEKDENSWKTYPFG